MFSYFLEFTFQGFWHFIGIMLLIAIIAEGIGAIIGSFIPSNDNHYHIDGTDINGDDLKEFIDKKEDDD